MQMNGGIMIARKDGGVDGGEHVIQKNSKKEVIGNIRLMLCVGPHERCLVKIRQIVPPAKILQRIFRNHLVILLIIHARIEKPVSETIRDIGIAAVKAIEFGFRAIDGGIIGTGRITVARIGYLNGT